MKTPSFLSLPLFSLVAVIGSLTLAQPALAGAAYWTPGGVDTNWSTSGNWIGGTGALGVPGSLDSVVFGPAGTSPTAFLTSNYVDSVNGAFGGIIGSLLYTNTAAYQNTLIAPGISLVVTNATGAIATVQAAGNVFMVGGSTAGTSGGTTISGPGASLVASNMAGQFLVSQAGTAASLNLSNLDIFVAEVSRVGVGVPPNYGWGVIPQAEGGALVLAKTNYISTVFSVAPGVTTSYTNWTYNYTSGHEIEEAIEVGNGADNSIGAASSILLGLTNGFNIDSIGVGKSKSSGAAGVVKFNPAFTNQNPTAWFRGTNGSPSGRVAFVAIGDNVTGGSSSSGATGTMDFTGGSIDAMVDLIYLGLDKNGNTSTSTLNQGILTFTAGTINVNSLIAGAQEASTAANNEGCVGVVNVSGAAAVLVVNNSLELGHTTVATPSGIAAARTGGALNITNGAAYINNIIVGALSASNAVMVNGGTLIVSNTLATNIGLGRLSLSNATLGVAISASGLPVGAATNLVTGGSTNVIQLMSVPVFSTYPQQIKLLKYTSLAGAGYNFGFGSTTVPSTAPNAYLSNNVTGKSVDLVLPNDPRPVIGLPEPASYSGNLGDNVAFSVVVNPASATPLSYQWYYYYGGATNAVANGATADGATISGATNATLTIMDGHADENGNYFVGVANAYGSAASSVAVLDLSQTCVPPSIAGPFNQTVTQGGNATFAATVSANPAATIWWTRNGSPVPNANSSSLTISNVQYPGDDQALFCIYASNACGLQSNCATLSVIVEPVISNQPVSLVITNGQEASFSVVAGGVPAPGYQWNFNNGPIPGAANPSALTANLIIASASPSNMGAYSVTITNAAGTVTSSSATLTVNSASLAIASTSPANGQTGVCYDTPLAISFSQPPSLGTAGLIHIYNATNATSPVDTIDVSLGALQPRSVGGIALNSYAVLINGNVANIYPHSNVMIFNQTYYVTIDNGVFTDGTGANFVGLTNTNAWNFTTKPTGPVSSTDLMVAADGSGDFVTVQGAVDFVPVNNTTPTTINVGAGTFTEIVRVNTKNNISIIGQSRPQTIVAYANNNNINPASSTRPSFGFTSANDCSVQNLTISNSTPHGGSQAEALYINSSKRFICLNANVDSYQDTILCNAAGDQEYVQDSHVQGDVDFIWGVGTLYATNCELTSMTSGGHLTQPRTLPGSNGLAFVNCLIDGAPGVTGSDLGRDAANSGNGNYFYGQDAYIDCIIDTNVIIPAGWVLGSGTLAGNTTFLRFWEFQSVDTNGNPVNTSARVLWSTEIDGDTATNGVQNVSNWFSGWTPALAPNIIGQPRNLSVAGEASAQFYVTATGIPAPSYQWLFNGNPVGSNSSSYVIGTATANNAGTYTVVVSNASGLVTSHAATLTVGNTAPTFGSVHDQTVNVGVTVNVADVATDPDVPAQSLTYNLSSGPADASLNPTTGEFTWRPTVSAAGSMNLIVVAVTDNGAGNLSATNSFNIVVNPLSQPDLLAPAFSNGQFLFTVAGEAGPDYALQVSANLSNPVWTTLLRTNSPSSPFIFIDTNASGSQEFYRVIVGPPLP